MMALDIASASSSEIADAVSGKKVTARAVIEAVLDRIRRVDPDINAFTDVVSDRALAKANAIDSRIGRGEHVGSLAGVPFAVKNLFDIEGLPTRAGSKINRERPPAVRDGALIRRLEAAGAILVGGLNMGEYAYDFTGENVHDGASRNPHDPEYMSGGSSGGSGSALAAGMVPLTLGSDTNGSIRVPSAFCGTFGLKPTFGRLTRAGSFPFVTSLDHLGPLSRSVTDLALSYDAMQGPDADDPGTSPRPVEPVTMEIGKGVSGLRIAVARGYFARGGMPEAYRAVETVASALGVEKPVELPEVPRARAAAFLITASEGAALHIERLRQRPADFDPVVRDRLLAGAMIPALWVQQSQRFRRWYRDRVLALFDEVDIILAPSTPCRAPRLGQKTFVLDGQEMLVRPNIGIYTQPISFIGLPVAAVPVWLDDGLPLGVQVIAAPWREDLALRVAYYLERAGVSRAPVASL